MASDESNPPRQADALDSTYRLLETTIAHVDQGIALFDAGLRLILSNRQYGILLGIDPDRLRAGTTSMLDVVRILVARGEFGARRAEDVLDDVMARTLAGSAARIDRMSVQGRWIQVNRKLLPDRGIVVTLTDVTAARAAEDALARTHALLATTFANMDQGFSVFSADRVLRACNARHLVLLGLEDHEFVIGETRIEEMIRPLALRGEYGPGDPDAITAQRADWLFAGNPSRGERRMSNGTWVQLNANPLPDGGVVITLTDVTAIKEAERKLEASRDEATRARMQLADAVEAIADGFVLWDAQDRLVAFNSRYRDEHSYVPDLLKPGVRFEDVIRESARRGLSPPGIAPEEWVQRRLREHRDPVGPYVIRRRDGRWLQMTEYRTLEGGIVGIRTDVTRMLASEEEARASQRRLMEAIEAISEGFVLWDAEDRLVAFNSRYRDEYSFAPEMLQPGVSFEAIIRESVRRGMVPVGYDPEQWVRDRIDQHRNPRGPYIVERRDGRSVMITEYKTQEGGIVGIRTDVTRLRESEAAAKASQLRLVAAIESVPQGFVMYGPDDRVVLYNSRYLERFTLVPDLVRPGLSFEELTREALKRGLVSPPPQDPERWIAEHVAAHRAAARKFVSHRNNRWIAVEESRTENGDIVVIHTDITDLKQRERELTRSRRLLRGVIDAVPAIINVKDRQSRYVLMNRFQGEVYGVEPADAIGRVSADFVGARYGGESNAMDEQVIRSGAALPWSEREFVDVHGTPHTWLTAKLPLKDDRNRVENVVTVALDITQLKATDRARANLSRYLAPSMVDALAKTDEPFGPPRVQPVAVLFADMVGFTRLAASEQPEAVFQLLRAFNGQLARTVFDNGGTLDKFTGDGIMATFGTPAPTGRDAANALTCARAIAAGLAEWNRARVAIGAPAIRVGIGVHWGDALMGTIGDEHRLEFAVVGDTVNVASRLETLSRELDADVAASDALVAMAREQGGAVDGFVARGPQALRGRSEPVAVWTLSLARRYDGAE